MTMTSGSNDRGFDIRKFNIVKFDSILARGLSNGLGEQGSQVCIEAAICEALGLPHGDDPKCVADSVRRFKIRLNDARWSSPDARAKGLRDLGLAQLGSLGVVSDVEFAKRIAEKTIRRLIPELYRELWPGDKEVEAVVVRCALEGTREVVLAAKKVADARYDAAASAADAAYATDADAAAYAADAAAAAAAAAYADAAYAAAADAAYAAAAYAAADAAASAAAAAARKKSKQLRARADHYLILGATLALEVLCELKSPGCELLDRKGEEA